MNEQQWLVAMSHIRDTWNEPFVPRLYSALRAHDQRDVSVALEWLATVSKALPAPGRFLEAVSVAKRNRERQGTTTVDLPTGRPADPDERIEAFRRTIRETVERECRGLEGAEREARAAAVVARFADLSPIMAEAAASL